MKAIVDRRAAVAVLWSAMSDVPSGTESREYSLAEPDPAVERPARVRAPEQLAVPAVPLHTCAQCGYTLTGLISRQCPECGTRFSLYTGMNLVREEVKLAQDIRAIWIAWTKAVIGSLAIAFALAAPWFRATNRGGFYLALFVSLINIFVLGYGAKFLMASQTMQRPDWLLRVGVSSAAFCAVILWLM